jgi:hypothetical protein
MRKILVFLIFAFCLCLFLGETLKAEQRSFEEEILDILKNKKIITHEQFQELTHKLKVEGKSVNEEILDLLKEREIVTPTKYEALKEKVVAEKKEEEKKVVGIPKGLKGVKFKGLWYLTYEAGRKSGEDYNEFGIGRGYIDFRKELTPWLKLRVTPDVHQDSTGDYKVRLKYLYAKFLLPDFKSVFTKNYVEAGMVHMPWLDFEEHINPYRVQGTMFIERNGIFNSADLGLSLFGQIGGEMPKEYNEKVKLSHHFAGRYGSYALSVLNGGGYHASEKNEEKVFEARLTLRPFPDFIPGLQVSYFNITGEGNVEEGKTYYVNPDYPALGIKEVLEDPPDWNVHLAFLSYESSWGALTGQYAWVEGSQKGEYKKSGDTIVDDRDKEGFSFFGYVRAPWNERYSVFARYDYWDSDEDISGDFAKRYIGGISYDILKGTMLVLSYDHVDFTKDKPNEHFFQTALQIKF